MEAERFCSVIMEKFFFAETVAADGMRYGKKKERRNAAFEYDTGNRLV